MKKLILVLFFIALSQIIFKIMPVLPLDDESEIKNVITEFLNALSEKNLNSVMQCISVNYHYIQHNNVIDYYKFKSELERLISNHEKRFIDDSFTNLKIRKLDIQNNKATVEIEFILKAFNLDTLNERTTRRVRSLTLIKENGSWKITKYKTP